MLASCGTNGPTGTPQFYMPSIDLEQTEYGKADGNSFKADHLMEEHLFVDAEYMTTDQVQEFLEYPPYSHPSYLADYWEDGQLASEIITDAAREHQISPMVLLVKLQVEASLIYASAPSDFQLSRAMGCGCLDGAYGCPNGPKGFKDQVYCGARLFRKYLDALDNGFPTPSGWEIGVGKKTQDSIYITPKNGATAALYTYTPWVLEWEGGNWLFWNVHQRYSEYILRQFPNHRWVGTDCNTDSVCAFEDGFCHLLHVDESNEDSSDWNEWETPHWDTDDEEEDDTSSEGAGFCTRLCSQYCPDNQTPFMARTFCVDAGSKIDNEPTGLCLVECDTDLFSDNDGCAKGFRCEKHARFGDEDVSRSVCWPENL